MKKFFKGLITWILIAALCVAGFFVTGGYTLYKSALRDESIEARIEKIKSDSDYTALSNIPEIYKDAVIAVEDSRFYSHNGVDFVALFRAVVVNIKNKELSQGGSTITQQFAKNLLFSHKQSIYRKIAELFATHYIEENYEKDEILELYMNIIYYGDGYYNICDASRGYFGVTPDQMSDYQATLLAGIPNAPSVYAPTKNPELAKKRQDKVLERMVETGVLTEEEKAEILQER